MRQGGCGTEQGRVEGRTVVPSLSLKEGARLTDLCVDRSKLTERAENINKAPVGSIKHHGSIMHHVRAEKAAVAAAAADCAGSIRGA